jgi:hypothetical protein
MRPDVKQKRGYIVVPHWELQRDKGLKFSLTFVYSPW